MKFDKPFAYVWKNQRYRYHALLIFVVLAFFATWFFKEGTMKDWAFWSPALSLGTLAMALVIWYAERKEEWEASLQKRLTVCFLYPPESEGSIIGNKIALLCCNATLLDEGDLRQFAQSIGRQMVGGGNLNLSAIVEQGQPELSRDNAFKHYTVYLQLKALHLHEKATDNPIFLSKETYFWNAMTTAERVSLKKTLPLVRDPKTNRLSGEAGRMVEDALYPKKA